MYIEDRAIEFSSPSGGQIRLSWVNAAPSIQSRADWALTDPTGNVSYHCNQPRIDLWRQAVPGYGRLTRSALYPKIDWELHGRGDRLEYDLVIHPGGNLENARLRVEGATARLDSDGRLRAGDLLHWRPEAYQWIDGKRIAVAASLLEHGNGEFDFELGPHSADRDLIVDPVIQTITVSGGSDEDAIVGSDSSNSCSYRYGTTRSADWSHLPGAGRSVFVQLGGKTIFWGGDGDSQIGGADSDLIDCRLYLVGWTSAQNAPILSASYDNLVARSYAGGATDGFFLEIAVPHQDPRFPYRPRSAGLPPIIISGIR